MILPGRMIPRVLLDHTKLQLTHSLTHRRPNLPQFPTSKKQAKIIMQHHETTGKERGLTTAEAIKT